MSNRCPIAVPFTAAIALMLFAPMIAPAAIVNLPDALDKSGVYDISNPLGVDVNNDVIYARYTMNFDLTLTPPSSFNIIVLADGATQKGFGGQSFGDGNWGVGYTGNGKTVSSTAIVSPGSTLLVYKVDQSTGTASLYVNPNLGQTELANAGAIVVTRINAPPAHSSIDTVLYRGGTTGNGNDQVDFLNVAFYYGGDTPFASSNAAVPTPATLPAGLALIGLVAARRRNH